MRAHARPDATFLKSSCGADSSSKILAAARAKVAAEKEAGATYFILDLGRYPDEQSFGKSVETFMTKVAS